MQDTPFPRRTLLTLASATTLGAWLPCAQAHDFKAGEIVIDHPYATPSIAGTTTGGAYFRSLTNRGKAADRIVGASTPVAERVELHSMVMDGDVMRMRQVPAIDLPPGQEVRMRHGQPGLHLMLINLKKPLADGERFDLTLRFERNGERKVTVWVQQPRDAGTAPAHKH